MKPIFQLDNYSFSDFLFSANLQFQKEKYQHPDLMVVGNIAQMKTEKDTWGVSVKVETPKDMDNETFPFKFSVTVVAFIKSEPVPPDFDILRAKRLLYVNAASLLYSAIRDRLSLFTASSPIGCYLLPTHRFNPEDIKDNDNSKKRPRVKIK